MNSMLYRNLKGVELYDYYSPLTKKIQYFHIESVPYFFYPNNKPCFEANFYIINKISRSSGKINHGTLKIYSNHISHIIRYIYINNIQSFTDLNNESFSNFIKFLQFEKKNSNKNFLRTNNQVISIGRQCLDFLRFVGELYNLENFIGESEAYSILVKIKKHLRKNRFSSSLSHSSFPLPSNKQKRYPISNDVASKIYKHVTQNPNIGLRIRNTCLIDSLEQTGARRQEILLIRVEDVRLALQSELICPMLQLRTLKTRKELFRVIPVPKTYLQNLSLYIRRIRKKIIEKTIGLNNDHGYVFISHSTGKPLSPDTFTTYMHKWASEINLNGQAFAHLYRHRFITEKFKCLILEHQINNPDTFRQLLINTHKFQQIIQQWTGHTSLESLNVYINLAYSDLSNIDQTIENVISKVDLALITEKINILTEFINSSDLSSEEKVFEITFSLQALASDLKHIKK
ncbi:tyrosine-type recombinase/integrase [uncultured Acinetobacter sp.]|uniref:tyrosine-type recombinase/integrase n=1 Tax=uncultured Acinetobacter sp. TaxID=165433 RepID=UPI002582F24B|nr:tyrosine-type recombinase/integrase [uncultured Acinetobacter sp.]